MITLSVSLGTLDKDGLYREVEYPGYERALAQFGFHGRTFTNATRVIFWRESREPVLVTHSGFHEPITGLAICVWDGGFRNFDPEWGTLQFLTGMVTISIPAPKEAP